MIFNYGDAGFAYRDFLDLTVFLIIKQAYQKINIFLFIRIDGLLSGTADKISIVFTWTLGLQPRRVCGDLCFWAGDAADEIPFACYQIPGSSR